jgi:phosphoglucomutase/phosphopentomutase
MANIAQDLEKREGKTVLLAYEEAIGYMCSTRVLDKDGIFAGVRMAELIAYLKRERRTLKSLLADLYKE